jgi:hypothetical protein
MQGACSTKKLQINSSSNICGRACGDRAGTLVGPEYIYSTSLSRGNCRTKVSKPCDCEAKTHTYHTMVESVTGKMAAGEASEHYNHQAFSSSGTYQQQLVETRQRQDPWQQERNAVAALASLDFAFCVPDESSALKQLIQMCEEVDQGKRRLHTGGQPRIARPQHTPVSTPRHKFRITSPGKYPF